MNIALLNVRITIQKNHVTVDEIGNHIMEWEDYFSCHATPTSGSRKERPIDRDINTALYALRCVQCGLSFSTLEHMSIGMVYDLFIEMGNDKYDYPYRATQADIDRL